MHSESSYKLCLKDLSENVVEELTFKLGIDPGVMVQFFQAFGLCAFQSVWAFQAFGFDPKKILMSSILSILRNIRELYPDTSVTTSKNVAEALKLYDLVELLDKAKPRELRPALSLKEIENLTNANNRPTRFFSDVAVLIIDHNEAEKIESFFKALNSQHEVK